MVHNRERSWREVFIAFLKLGLTSFGGPIAHIGYFRTELVERRRWVDDTQFAQLLAVCQFLPGPASSQLGFSLGLSRAGWAGALAAFIAFTLPSVILLLLFAAALPQMPEAVQQLLVHALKLVALAVVAQAVLAMAKGLCPDWPRRLLAVAAAVFILWQDSAIAQLLAVLAGAVIGLAAFREAGRPSTVELGLPVSPRSGLLLIVLFFLLLFGLPLAAKQMGGLVAVGEAFYRAGALVFGGGHVVLPLLEQSVVAPGWLSQEDFLAGYGAAQAIPGPLFSVAAFYGALLDSGLGGLSGAITATLALFLPGFLLVAGVLPLWQKLSGNRYSAGAIAGINAAVVGVLAAALYNPVFTSAVTGIADLVIALVGFGLLQLKKSPLWVVAWCLLAVFGLASLSTP
ncbi:chromate efflux transporter [Biformimicrobium ophioploci]|uniref:Chromate efflux transporter n=1 Tax=Biformimicrobium ophioploci TaxID=3036711 RepID=A0ABQ6M0Z2_9GAMM|nr:chromate efflux transporter [Microbulbifer sp. NKW57]GMG87992.1 chromate efflux transporter [Microbulbifer sp. NKW57]